MIEDRAPEDVLTPEDLSEEERRIGATCANWMEREVLPRVPEILALDYGTTRELLRKAGDLGLLGVEIPERYGGLGLGKVAATVVAENASSEGSFAVTFSAHTGIGTLPILYFGSPEQRQRYLPKLASGEWVSSYSLSEASSASDALNAKARAVRSSDEKSWILNGEKMWLTNAGFADVYVTFAKVDGEHFTAFILEKGMPGVTLGPEEKKTGINGSSTRALILNEARIPKENVLGEVGKGHKVAFNVLNLGRFKLGAGVTGGAKLAIGEAVKYATQRLAFGRPISDFGLIRHKLSEMAILAYVSESMVYRTAGLLDESVAGVDLEDQPRHLRWIEEYDVECSIAKVWCSEALDYVVDQTVQIYGSAGYVKDYPAERYWRDARIYRIFEGTNEINRLLIPGRLLRRALRGELPLFDRAMSLLSDEHALPELTGFLAQESRMLSGAKKIALLCLGLAAQRFGEALAEEQEILGLFADVAMATYALESALLRAQKQARRKGPGSADLASATVRCFAQDALDRIESSARRILPTLAEDTELDQHLERVRRFSGRPIVNTVALRRQIAAAVVECGGYWTRGSLNVAR